MSSSAELSDRSPRPAYVKVCKALCLPLHPTKVRLQEFGSVLYMKSEALKYTVFNVAACLGYVSIPRSMQVPIVCMLGCLI